MSLVLPPLTALLLVKGSFADAASSSVTLIWLTLCDLNPNPPGLRKSTLMVVQQYSSLSTS